MNLLELAAKVVNKAHTIPILDTFCIKNGQVQACDLEKYFETFVPEFQNIEVCLDAKKLLKILKLVDKDSETVVTCDQDLNVKIQSGKQNFKLVGQSVDEFPVFPGADPEDKPFEHMGGLTDTDTMLVKRAVKYAANDKLRPFISHIFVDDKHIAATDAHRLCFYENSGKMALTCLILKDLAPLLPAEGCTVSDNGKYLKFVGKDYNLYQRKFEGEYPTWRAVIPENREISFIASSKDLQKALTSAMAIGGSPSDKCSFYCDELGVDLRKQDTDFQENFSYNLTAENLGEATEIGFDPKRLKEIIDAEKDIDYVFSLNGPDRAFIINGKVLLMPTVLSNR